MISPGTCGRGQHHPAPVAGANTTRHLWPGPTPLGTCGRGQHRSAPVAGAITARHTSPAQCALPCPQVAGLTKLDLPSHHSFYIILILSKTIGYMLTWTTYGSWLPGDERGYVANARILPADGTILERNIKRRKSPAVKLNAKEKEIVEQTIRTEAEKLGHKLEAIIVCSNHVHLLARRHAQSIEEIVGRYKSLTTRALWQKGRIWSKGYDKRFCFTEQDIGTKAKYIANHNG